MGSFGQAFDKSFYDSKLLEIKAIDCITLKLSQDDFDESEIKRVITIDNKYISVTIEELSNFKGKL